MKPLFTLIMLCLLVVGPASYADGPDDQYVRIYNTLREGDTLAEGGKSKEALSKYEAAQTALKQFQRANPEWNVKVVTFRLNYLAGKISGLEAKVPKAAPQAIATATNVPSTTAAPTQPTQPERSTAPGQTPPLPTEAENQVKSMKQQIQQMESDQVVLEAKLKEALSARPAAVDPAEMAKSEERVKELQKENDLLKVSIEQLKTKPVQAAESGELAKIRTALADANRKLAEQAEINEALRLEKEAVAGAC